MPCAGDARPLWAISAKLPDVPGRCGAKHPTTGRHDHMAEVLPTNGDLALQSARPAPHSSHSRSLQSPFRILSPWIPSRGKDQRRGKARSHPWMDAWEARRVALPISSPLARGRSHAERPIAPPHAQKNMPACAGMSFSHGSGSLTFRNRSCIRASRNARNRCTRRCCSTAARSPASRRNSGLPEDANCGCC